TSMFLLWIGLAGAALLCALRAPLARSTVAMGSAAVLALITAVVATVSVCAYLLGRTQMVIDAGGAALFPQSAGNFAVRNVWIGLVVAGLALRYFYVAHEWRRSVELRAAARVHALQARIRPHFLFNSMNTIAALTRSNPARRGRHGDHYRRSRRRARDHRGAQPARPESRRARGQPPGARQHPRAPEPRVRGAGAHEIGALRRGVHRDAEIPAHREARRQR